MSQNNTYWLIAVPGENSKEEVSLPSFISAFPDTYSFSFFL